MTETLALPRLERGAGQLYIPKGSTKYMARLYIPGLGHKKRATGTRDLERAKKFLTRWKLEIDGGAWKSESHRLRFEQMADMLREDYRANERDSLIRVDAALWHLGRAFAGKKARAITTDVVTKYITRRQTEDTTITLPLPKDAPPGTIAERRPIRPAKNATINRELACLKRMFTLAIEADKLASRPVIKMLEERNARKGFFEEQDLQRLLVHLPDHIKAVVEVAYYTGWRVASEILTRQWKHVDLTAGWLRLEPGETKNGEGRMFPLTGRLRQVLEEQRERTRVVEREQGRIVPWLFHQDGERVKSIAARGNAPAGWPGSRARSRTTSDGPPSGTWSAPASHVPSA